jgi:signal transduction histidine kinase
MHDSLNGKSDKKNIEILGIAVNNIDRLNRLLDSLLDLAKFEAGKAVIKRSYIDLKNLISECVDFIRSNAEAKGIKINTDFFVRYSKIWADEDKITQVVNNLLNNAIKFTPKDGAVNITVKEDDGKILLSVQDSGIGIKKEDIPKLFNRFERITSPQLKTEGTGLGLAICKEIVDIHKGKIWAESASPKGTKFNIMLPKDLRREERYSS